MKALKLSGFLILAVMFVINGCRKPFDEPPVAELPLLEANATIADLLAKRDLTTNIPAEITTDLVIKGVVVADDRSGNFYKKLIIQDSTGGIDISIDAFNLFNNYPVGREVWIRCKGLYVWNKNDLPTMGISSDPSQSRIPEALLSEYLVGGERDKPVTPKTRTFSTLVDTDLNTLVTFDEVQFKGGDAGATYANPITQFSENRKMEDCAKAGEIILRSSGYSDFAGAVTPTGSGKITAVYTIHDGIQQLVIRDLEDVQMDKARCGGGGTVIGPAPTPNGTIADLLALRDLSSNTPVEVTTDLIIKTTVVGDDKSGNFFKQLVLQDGTGGINVNIDANDLFNDYPIGREVYLKCKGLYVWNKNDLPNLGFNIDPSLSRIPKASIAQFIVGGEFGKYVTPKSRTFATLVDADLNTLVTFDDVQFKGSDAGATYADAAQLFSENRTIEGCNQTGEIILRSSGYSSFADDKTPTNSGKITGVYTIYNGTQQLVIRELSDVDMTATRCAGGGGPVSGTGCASCTSMDISAVRALYTGSTTTIPASRKIKGIVISDTDEGNITGKNVVVQDGTAGIVIRFTSNNTTLKLGDSLEIEISNATLSEYNGLLQADGIDNTKANVISSGNTPTPRVTTITQLLANFETWESTLVQINNATISGGATYGDNPTLNDGASIDLYTRSSANFAGTAVKSGQVQVTAIVSQFNLNGSGEQLNLRKASDVQ